MPFTSIKVSLAARLALIIFTASIFFSQTARAKLTACEEALRLTAPLQSVRVKAFAVQIAGLDLVAPEVLYFVPSAAEADEAILERVLGTPNFKFKGEGKNRRVFSWTSPTGRSMVAKIYQRHADPLNIAAKMQRELLVEEYLKKIGISVAPVLKSLPEGIVIQSDVGMVVTQYLAGDKTRRTKIQPHLSKLGSQFFHSPIRDFETFLRAKYPEQGHHDVDRTLENIGITVAEDSGVELQMVDW